jgi:hypothetical protein
MAIKNSKVLDPDTCRCVIVANRIAQPETLIVWTEQNGTDMALSFQEAEGCAVIW